MLDSLTSTEERMLHLLATGQTVQEIAATEGVKPGSVSMRVTRAREKLEAHTIVHAVMLHMFLCTDVKVRATLWSQVYEKEQVHVA